MQSLNTESPGFQRSVLQIKSPSRDPHHLLQVENVTPHPCTPARAREHTHTHTHTPGLLNETGEQKRRLLCGKFVPDTFLASQQLPCLYEYAWQVSMAKDKQYVAQASLVADSSVPSFFARRYDTSTLPMIPNENCGQVVGSSVLW